jgi:hypothetical protein
MIKITTKNANATKRHITTTIDSAVSNTNNISVIAILSIFNNNSFIASKMF